MTFHKSLVKRFAPGAIALLAVAIWGTPAAGQDADIAVRLRMPMLNGEVHQMRIRCAVCKGRCGSSLTATVASGELMLGFGGLGNHPSPDRTETLRLEVPKGNSLEQADSYACHFELRHYLTAESDFFEPVPALELSASNLWRAAQCGTQLVSSVEGRYLPGAGAFEAEPFHFTGIAREG